MIQERTPAWDMGKSKSLKTIQKEKVGPGSYHDGLMSSQRVVLTSSKSYSIPKSQTQHAIVDRANRSKYIPGVGTYKDMDKAYSNNLVWKKSRVAGIFPYKTSRFTDEVIKNKSWVPGPGTYGDILPKHLNKK